MNAQHLPHAARRTPLAARRSAQDAVTGGTSVEIPNVEVCALLVALHAVQHGYAPKPRDDLRRLAWLREGPRAWLVWRRAVAAARRSTSGGP